MVYFYTIRGRSLHFGADHRKPGTAYLMFPCLDPHFEFDTEFDKTLKNQCFSPFRHRQKSPHTTQKHLSNPYKIRLQSNSTKNHIQSTKFHLINYQNHSPKIIQNTSKINTFQPY